MTKSLMEVVPQASKTKVEFKNWKTGKPSVGTFLKWVCEDEGVALIKWANGLMMEMNAGNVMVLS